MNEKIKLAIQIVISIALLYYTWYTWRVQVDTCNKWNGYVIIGQCMCPPGYFDWTGGLATVGVVNFTTNQSLNVSR